MTKNTAVDSALLMRQVAFVRTLRDELEHHSPSDRVCADLRAQLHEEELRLAQLLSGATKT